MKEAMWSVDRTGDFRFSDQDNPTQLDMFSKTFDDAWLADELRSRLAGKTLTVAQIKEFILTQTPCYLFKSALQSLETGKHVVVVKAPTNRKPGKYPEPQLEQIELRFEKSLFG